jgi:putative tryptophan/tyrosine transport system substrate-binding protein
MRRREFIGTALGACISFGSAAAAQPRRARLGWLSGGPEGMTEGTSDILKQALQELGWKLGETLEVDERRAGGDASRLPRLAQEIVAGRPTVIACTGGTEAGALQAATPDIPIVFMQVAVDPVAAKLVESISRPGGNVTGFLQAPQLLSGKRLDILTELLERPPRRLAYIVNPGNVNATRLWTDGLEAATRIGGEIRRVDVSGPADIEEAFASLKDRDALLVQYDFLLVGLRMKIAELATRHRLPVMYENKAHVTVGGLISYGGDLRDNYRQGAIYVDRILRGAHPRDLPVVQGSRLELVLNVTTAKALNLPIPPTLLARADEVIE